MQIVAWVLSGFVALEHFGFLVLESFLWTKPIGRRIFGQTEEFAKAAAPLAANQGLYNGFLGAGLIWGLCIIRCDSGHAFSVLTFFLACVIVAALVGAVTVKRSILVVQGLPAVLAMGALWATRLHS